MHRARAVLREETNDQLLQRLASFAAMVEREPWVHPLVAEGLMYFPPPGSTEKFVHSMTIITEADVAQELSRRRKAKE